MTSIVVTRQVLLVPGDKRNRILLKKITASGMDNETVKTNILKIREEMKLTQSEFADRLGISRNAFRAIECGQTKIFNDNINAIAAVAGMTPEEVVLGYKPVENADQILREEQSRYMEEMAAMAREYEERLQKKDEKIEDLKKQVALLEQIKAMLEARLEQDNSQKDC